MTYRIQYHRHGTLVKTFDVPCYNKGESPSVHYIMGRLDQRLSVAVYKGQWTPDHLTSDVMRMDLWGSTGKPLGSIVAIDKGV